VKESTLDVSRNKKLKIAPLIDDFMNGSLQSPPTKITKLRDMETTQHTGRKNRVEKSSIRCEMYTKDGMSKKC